MQHRIVLFLYTDALVPRQTPGNRRSHQLTLEPRPL